MSYFPLPYRATIERGVETVARSGQRKIESYTTVETNVKCLYLATSGSKRTAVREDFETVLAFYLEPTANIEEGDIVTNIKDKTGTVIEAGRFEVLAVKKVPGLGGKVHHLSCKLRGLA